MIEYGTIDDFAFKFIRQQGDVRDLTRKLFSNLSAKSTWDQTALVR
jgi:hypothetical protein